jgi:hypothetical protein
LLPPAVAVCWAEILEKQHLSPAEELAMNLPGQRALRRLGHLILGRRKTVTTVSPAGVTFPVSNVSPATKPLPELPYHQAVTDFLGGPVESCSRYHGRLVANVRSHPLIAALHAAFASHRPVRLSPDIVWLTLAQGLAHHVNANAEQLRHRFVGHGGKLTIQVRRDDFVKGSPENPWPEVFGEFSAAIRGHIGEEAHGLVAADFSTTGPVERAASEVVLLDAMQAFFDYELHTLCGIPSITLEGTVEDWRSVASQVRGFAPLGLGWWVEALEPVLNQFVAAAEGRMDRGFWESVYKWRGPKGSGSPHVSGWVLDLFPYLVNPEAKYARRGHPLCRNPWLGVRQGHRGPGRDDFPGLPSRAPFRWLYFDRVFEMEFVGGLIGVRQDAETLSLRPEVGWAVREAGATGEGTAAGRVAFDSL